MMMNTQQNVFDLNAAIATFDSVASVVYKDKKDDSKLIVPHETKAKSWFMDCTVLDAETGERIGCRTMRTKRFGEPLGYIPNC